MKTSRIDITGMTCPTCAMHIRKSLQAVPGMVDVRVALGEGATVKHELADEDVLLRAVQAAGDYEGRFSG
jgi:copper chaperone CopZ